MGAKKVDVKASKTAGEMGLEATFNQVASEILNGLARHKRIERCRELTRPMQFGTVADEFDSATTSEDKKIANDLIKKWAEASILSGAEPKTIGLAAVRFAITSIAVQMEQAAVMIANELYEG